MGKVLLAHLPMAERQAYVAAGPFVALTASTISQADALARELQRIAEQGFAEDRGEILPDLFCLSVPVRRADDSVAAAISLSMTPAQFAAQRRATLSALRRVADELQAFCGPSPDAVVSAGRIAAETP